MKTEQEIEEKIQELYKEFKKEGGSSTPNGYIISQCMDILDWVLEIEN